MPRWPQRTVLERLYEKVLCDVATRCWNFTGSLHPQGYGCFYGIGRHEKAHRVSYKLNIGPIPKGVQLHHVCENPRCVNPEHLMPVDQRTHTALTGNHISKRLRAQTHCKRGHPLTLDNLLLSALYGNAKRRICLTCFRAKSRRYYSENAEKCRSNTAAWRERNLEEARRRNTEAARERRKALRTA